MENLTLADNLRNAESISLYLDNILLNLPINLFWMDKEGRILCCSANQAKTFGLKSAAELVGKNIFDVAKLLGWKKSIAEEIRKNDLDVMQNKKMQTREEVVLLNGQYRTFLTCKSPLLDNNKAVMGIFGFAFDISERKQLEKELITARQSAEAASHALKLEKDKVEKANQTKKRFLENIQHEISKFILTN